MQNQNQLTLNRSREFGDIIGDGFKFMRINLKPMINVFVTYVVPLLLFPLILILMSGQADTFFGFFSFDPDDFVFYETGFSVMSWLAISVFVLCYILAYMVLNLTVFGAVLAYQDNGNQAVTADQIKDKIKVKFSNYLVSFIVLVGFALAFYLVMILIVFIGVTISYYILVPFFLLLFVFGIWFFVVMQLFAWIRIKEDLNVADGVSRSFSLLKNNWWSFFSIMFVSSLVASMVSYIFIIPFYMIMGFSSISQVGGEGTAFSVVLAGLSFMIYMLGSLFLQQYINVCTILKYYDLVESKQGTSIMSKIDQLGENVDSYFENDGEY